MKIAGEVWGKLRNDYYPESSTGIVTRFNLPNPAKKKKKKNLDTTFHPGAAKRFFAARVCQYTDVDIDKEWRISSYGSRGKGTYHGV